MTTEELAELLADLLKASDEPSDQSCLLAMQARAAILELEKDAARYDWLVEIMKTRNVHLHYYNMTHEIPRSTFVFSDQETAETLGYGSTVDAAIDAVFARTAGCREQTAPRQSGTKPCV